MKKPGKNPGGRPSKLTPEVQAAIVKDLELGLYIDQAFQRAGIERHSHWEWLRRAKLGEAPFTAYAAAVEKASAQAEGHALAQVRKGSQNWQANAWFLERRFRERWARTVDNSGIADAPAATQFVVQFVKGGE